VVGHESEGPLADQLAQSGAPGPGAHHDEAEESGVDGLGKGDADPDGPEDAVQGGPGRQGLLRQEHLVL